MQTPGDFRSIISGGNAEFLEDLFKKYQEQPDSFSAEWQQFFIWLQNGSGTVVPLVARGASPEGPGAVVPTSPAAEALTPDEVALNKQAKVHQLIQTYRNFGHTRADLDPLGRAHMKNPPDLSLAFFGLNEADLDEKFSTGTVVAPPMETLRRIVEQMEATYCGSVGAEFMMIRDHNQRRWLRELMEGTWNKPKFDKLIKTDILTKLAQAELFERFLHTKFVGQKRFSLEGAETLIVMLDAMVEECAELGATTIVLGMPHRGRLNTLVNVMAKRLEVVFGEFKDVFERSDETGSGDVKYHMGYSSDRETATGKRIHLSLAFNPSHLEIVNPVVEGYVRARMDRTGDRNGNETIPVLMHGDAAFAGQGTVMETLNLSQLQGYKTGGTIHIIVNNQIGFTTHPRHSRSTLYPSDVVKMLNIPVIHVNGDDPEAAYHAMKLAVNFRQTFHTDIVVDLFCYRRHGHNEMDEPAFTQPRTYQKIKEHPSILEIYSNQLTREGSFTPEEIEQVKQTYTDEMEAALAKTNDLSKVPVIDTLSGVWSGLGRGVPHQIVMTEVDHSILKKITKGLTTFPKGFTAHPRLVKLQENRAKMITGEVPIDWGMGENLAYGSLVWEGFSVRFTGQDVTRGTFTHRHANFVDILNGEDFIPLQHLKSGQGQFRIFDSSLSEAGVLGFEFGYSLADPRCLTIWEAQFGDFANGAQMIFDQFITSSEAKWLRMSGLVVLLPHGMEGQGPEHSSARPERFLQMCAEDNIQVCNATTPAQFFHMMRRQLHRNFRKPLIVMTPKSLLRHPLAVSSPEDLIQGYFRELLYEKGDIPPEKVKRIVFCSGKVYYDLLAERTKRNINNIALIRLEQLYPFPHDQVEEVIGQYPKAKEMLWVQEEPRNMGGWTFVEPLFRESLPPKVALRYVGRKPSASPATGSHRMHEHEQTTLVDQALS